MARPKAAERAAGGDAIVRIDAPELKRLLIASRDFDRKLYGELRRGLRDAAEDALKDARATVQQPPPDKLGAAIRGYRLVRVGGGSKLRIRHVITGFETRAGRVRSRGTRAAIAAAMGVQIANSKREVGVTLRASQRKMPKGTGPMIKAYNTARFRHPVFGDPSRTRDQWGWAYQAGRPYFSTVINKHRKDMTAAVVDAMEMAAAALARAVETT